MLMNCCVYSAITGLFIFTLAGFSFGSPLSVPANTTQHNIPQHFPSSVCNCMEDADTIASIVHTFQMSQCSDSIILLTFKQYILNALQYHAHRTFLAGYLCEKTAQRTTISEHQISHVPFLLPHHFSLNFSFVLSLHIILFYTHFLTKIL